MSGNLFYENVEVEPIGVKVTIPNNDIAKLMYYLSCVITVISYTQDDILSDYEHYYLLNSNQKKVLFNLVASLNPLIFIKAGVFILDPTLVPNDMINEFYQITDHKIGIKVQNKIMVGGQWIKVQKIMACRSFWLYKFYIFPMKNLKKINIKEYEEYIPRPKPKNNNLPAPQNPNTNKTGSIMIKKRASSNNKREEESICCDRCAIF